MKSDQNPRAQANKFIRLANVQTRARNLNVVGKLELLQ